MKRVIKYFFVAAFILISVPHTTSAFNVIRFAENAASTLLAQINTNLPLPKSPQLTTTCGGNITVSWLPAGSDKVVSYKVTRSTTGKSDSYKEVATLSASEVSNGKFVFNDKVTAGTQYYYRIRSVNANGAVSSAVDVSGKSVACTTTKSATTTTSTPTTPPIIPTTSSIPKATTTTTSKTDTQPKNVTGTNETIQPNPVTATYLRDANCPSFIWGASLHQDSKCFTIDSRPPFYSANYNQLDLGGFYNNKLTWLGLPKPRPGATSLIDQQAVAEMYSVNSGPNYSRLRYAGSVTESPLLYYNTQTSPTGTRHRYRYLCDGVPNGWGCYYVIDRYATGENYYYTILPAYPPSAVDTFKVSCSAVADKIDQNGTYKNIKWTATPQNEGTNTTYTWTGDAASANTSPNTRTYVYPAPGKIARGSVTAKTVIDGREVTSNTATCEVTPPPNKTSLTCSAKIGDFTDPVTGEERNIEFTATSGFGSDYRYDWQGDADGSTQKVYANGAPGQTVRATIVGSATFPTANGTPQRITTSNADNTCQITVPNVVVSCVSKKEDGTHPGTGEQTNVVWTATARQGQTDVTNNATFKWKFGLPGQPLTEDANQTGRKAYTYVEPGEKEVAAVQAILNGNASAFSPKCPVNIQEEIKAACKGRATIDGYIDWTLEYSFMQDGVEFNQDNWAPESVKWATDNINPFAPDPILGEEESGGLLFTRIYYDLFDLSPGLTRQENIATFKIEVPDEPIAPGETAATYAKKKKKTKYKSLTINCEYTYTPISSASLAQKIHHSAEAALNGNMYTCSNVGCALATNAIVDMATSKFKSISGPGSGRPIGKSPATSQMVKDLKSASNRFRLIAGGKGDAVINAIRNSLPGDIIISPSKEATKKSAKVTGHVGVVGKPGAAIIISNNSALGKVDDHWEGMRWYNHYTVSKKLDTYIFRPIGNQ